MSEFFDYSPHNGMRYDSEEGVKDITIYSSQDVQPVVDRMHERRLLAEDKKSPFRHYCTIPTWLEVELRKKGIDIHNKHQTKELLKEINTNYPKLKATRMHHEI